MSNIISLKFDNEDDTKKVFSFINNKWRNASYERNVAKRDNKRINVETEARGKL